LFFRTEAKKGGFKMKNDTDFLEYDAKPKVAVLGATGVVGQVFLHMLAHHGRFELTTITGSDARAGKKYAGEVRWVLPVPMPETVAQMTLDALDISLLINKGIKIVFSALPADVAKTVEQELRDSGFYVFSNAGALRYENEVPILIPEANPESLDRIRQQGFPEKGFVVTNANCSTTGLATALAPLRPFGIKEVFVSTYQSVSGAGYPGLPTMDIMGNAIPFINREEDKLIVELKKILEIEPAVFPFCVRIPVQFGHLETVWITLEKDTGEADIRLAWKNFNTPDGGCPTLPEQPVVYCEENDFPQPKMSFWGTPPGMQVFTGRLKKKGNRIGFTLLVNNLVKGAAGGSIANAELFLAKYGHLCGPNNGSYNTENVSVSDSNL
jgi:aspartate-semialdehyde dehydrogenase